MALEGSKWKEGLVSIVTPVYNGEAHLAGMLNSVLAQTYPEIEMILADDGSEDATLQVAESYRERFAARGYAYRIVQAPHRNASSAINAGLPYVTGEYLIWPDSDDVLEPESVARRVAFLESRPQYQCVRSLSYYFDESTKERLDKADEQRGDLSREDLFWDILESRTFVCCGCYMLRSEPFFHIYPQRHIPEYDVGQNFQMLLPFVYRHKCPTIREELYGVAVRAGSHSRTGLTQEREEKRYAEYEMLVDDIAEICGMEDEALRQRITAWKAARRYRISLKYRRWRETLRALGQLHRCEGFRLGDAVKEVIWAFFVKGWVAEKVYTYYRKSNCRKNRKIAEAGAVGSEACEVIPGGQGGRPGITCAPARHSSPGKSGP